MAEQAALSFPFRARLYLSPIEFAVTQFYSETYKLPSTQIVRTLIRHTALGDKSLDLQALRREIDRVPELQDSAVLKEQALADLAVMRAIRSGRTPPSRAQSAASRWTQSGSYSAPMMRLGLDAIALAIVDLYRAYFSESRSVSVQRILRVFVNNDAAFDRAAFETWLKEQMRGLEPALKSKLISGCKSFFFADRA